MSEFGKSNREFYNIGDTLASAAYALHRLYFVNAALWINQAFDKSVLQSERIVAEFAADKALMELGLFSKDPERRLTVFRSLIHEFGGPDTLKLMKDIRDVRIGVPDPHLDDAIDELEQRLMEPGDESDADKSGEGPR